MGLLVARVIASASKLATRRMLHTDTTTSSAGPLLGVGDVADVAIRPNSPPAALIL